MHDDGHGFLQHLRLLRGADGPCGRLDYAAVRAVFRAQRRGAEPDHSVQPHGPAHRRGVYHRPVPGQIPGGLQQLCHDPLQRKHHQAPGRHPAAPGRRGSGHGADRPAAGGRRGGAQRGTVLGAGVRAGRPGADQARPDCRRRNPHRGPHQRPAEEPAQSAHPAGPVNSQNGDLEHLRFQAPLFLQPMASPSGRILSCGGCC